jgi:uncharacterized protein YjaZ
MELKDVLDVLCRYYIKHTDFPINHMSSLLDDDEGNSFVLKGLAIDDKKLILIDKEQGLENMRETILHELYHGHFYMNGQLHGKSMKETERVVRYMAYKHTIDLYQKR